MTAAVVFRKIFSKKRLRPIFSDRIRDSGAVGLDRVRPEALRHRLTDELDVVVRKVRSGSYRFTSYKQKLISKGAASNPRVISIPTARDRIVLRGLCDLLADVFPEAVSEIPQVKINALGKALASPKYQEYVKIDVREFYPSIDHEKLLKTLQTRIRKPEILALLEGSITTATVPEQKGGKDAARNACGVPQGLAISNILAEIFLSKLDAEMASIPRVWYQRYVDDILILCSPKKSSDLANHICARLEQLGLKPHRIAEGSKSKAGPLTEKFDFLGYHIVSRQLSIREQTVFKFESSLAAIFTAYRHKLLAARDTREMQRAMDICEWRLNLRITGCIFGGKRLGWVFYFSQITDISRLRAVDHTIECLLRRFHLDGKIRVKRLLKTFYECRRQGTAEHRYIPNFDKMPVLERRKILTMLMGRKLDSVSDSKINGLFEMKIGAAVKELEQDLAAVS